MRTMPYRAVLILALTTAPAKAAGTLFANDLALQCSSPEREPRLTCEAFVDGVAPPVCETPACMLRGHDRG